MFRRARHHDFKLMANMQVQEDKLLVQDRLLWRCLYEPARMITEKSSPMLLRDLDSIDIHSILEPALFDRDLNIITAHLPLAHAAIFRESPVFEAITTLPLHSIVAVLILIPELHCNLVVRKSEQLFAQTI